MAPEPAQAHSPGRLPMNFEHIYVFNRRSYAPAGSANGWKLLYRSPDAGPVRQPVDAYEATRATYWRRPWPLRSPGQVK